MGNFSLVGKGLDNLRAKVRLPRKRTAVNHLVWTRQPYLYLGSCCARRTQLSTAVYDVGRNSSLVLTPQPAFAFRDHCCTCSSSNPCFFFLVNSRKVYDADNTLPIRKAEGTHKEIFKFWFSCCFASAAWSTILAGRWRRVLSFARSFPNAALGSNHPLLASRCHLLVYWCGLRHARFLLAQSASLAAALRITLSGFSSGVSSATGIF